MIVEIAIAMPIFLFFVYIFIWLAVARNQITSFSSAVHFGTRLSITRGKKEVMGYDPLSENGLIPVLDKTTIDSNDAIVKSILSTEDLENSMSYTYDEWSQETLGLNFNELPNYYFYALAFIYQSLKRSVGNSVRFPCDPKDPHNNDPQKGDMCLKCTFINPKANDPYDGSPAYELETLNKSIGVICQYALPGLLPKLIGKTVNSDTEQLILTRSAYFYSQ